MKNSFGLITLLVMSNFCICQNHLDFVSNANNQKKLTFNVGDRIGYTQKGLSLVKSGVIQEIKDSLLIVNDKSVLLEDLKFIGHRKKGTNFYIIASAVLSGSVLGYFTLPKDNTSTQKIVGISLSVPLFAIGEIIGWKNRLHKVEDKYKYEVLHNY